MAASIEAGDRKALRVNWREYDKFLSFAGPAAEYGYKPGNSPVDQTAARWEFDLDEKAEEDRPRSGEDVHRVRGFDRDVEGRREKVRPHLAANPRRR